MTESRGRWTNKSIDQHLKERFAEIPSVRKEGDSNPRYGNLSKLLVSATHPSFQKDPGVRNRGVISLIAGAKVRLFFEPCKFSGNFFKFSLNFLHFCRSDKRDSNPRPSAWEANALPTELLSLDKKVLTLKNWREPIAGLEPATHALRMRCSTN